MATVDLEAIKTAIAAATLSNAEGGIAQYTQGEQSVQLASLRQQLDALMLLIRMTPTTSGSRFTTAEVVTE